MKALKLTTYKSVETIPSDVWEQLQCSSLYFSKEFLTAFERSNPRIDYRYYLIFEGERAVAFTVLQLIKLKLTESGDGTNTLARIAQRIQQFINRGNTRVLVCGNLFLSGPYGIHVSNSEGISTVYQKVLDEIKSTQIEHKAHIYFLKDFPYDHPVSPTLFTKERFQPFDVEPNMILTLDPKWSSFTDYQAALRSKYRIKLKKADKSSAALKVRPMGMTEIMSHKDKMQELLTQVTDRASYNAMDLRISTYAALEEELLKAESSTKHKLLINAYWLKEEMIGFATAFLNSDKLEAHFIGLNYDYNRKYAIYPRMLNDYVRMGIEHRVRQVNFGRTASEIKSTLGAKPQHMRCYLRHRRTFANFFFKPLVGHITMETYHQHEPFKQKTEN